MCIYTRTHHVLGLLEERRAVRREVLKVQGLAHRGVFLGDGVDGLEGAMVPDAALHEVHHHVLRVRRH